MLLKPIVGVKHSVAHNESVHKQIILYNKRFMLHNVSLYALGLSSRGGTSRLID